MNSLIIEEKPAFKGDVVKIVGATLPICKL